MLGLILDLCGFAASYILLWRILQILSIAMFIFSIIGIITTIKWLLGRRKPKESAGDKWLRTGKF